jgi:hypothetical protein
MKVTNLLTAALTLLALATANINAAPKPEQPKFLVRCDVCNKEQALTPTTVVVNGGRAEVKNGVFGNVAESTLTFKCKTCKKHTFTSRYELFTPTIKTMRLENRIVPVPIKAVPLNSAATNQAALLTLAPKSHKTYTAPSDVRSTTGSILAHRSQ